MTRQRRILVGAVGVGLVALTVMVGRPRPGALVAKYVGSPVPDGVHDIQFKTTDRFGIAPEFADHLSFTGPAEALTELVRRGRFQPTSVEFASGAPKGPPEWRPVETLGRKAQVYFRPHRPSRRGRGLPLGQNRSGSEVLWIDETGTNGFFTLWSR